MQYTVLSESQQQDALGALNRDASTPWEITASKLNKTFVFNNFTDAFAFISEIASLAETLNHHPEWCNIYNKVTISLITHDTKSITALDFQLAEQVEHISSRYPRKS